MIDRADISKLVIAAADGDRRAIDPLYAALWPPLVAYASRFLGDLALAEDCTQDALVRMFGQLDRFDRARDGLTWALAHVTWQCRTARRRRERRGETDEVVIGVHDARDSAVERDLIRAALDALATLAPRDIEVITAALADDDAGLRAQLAPATFRKRLERALERLRLSWRSRHDTP